MEKIGKETRSKIMACIRSKHTKPELLFRKLLRQHGIKYKLHYGKEKIDIAIPGKKLAIFIDGCFWHMCPKHGHIPKSNKKYWIPKLKKNLIRAKDKDKRLLDAGWKIVHIWEHELSNSTVCTKKIKKMRH